MGVCLAIDLSRGPLEAIDVEDLKPYESRIGQTDMLFIRTGADDMWGTSDYVWKYPYLTERAGHYLVEKGAKLVGLDTIGPDPALRSGLRKGSPLHLTLLCNDVLIIENLANLRSVVGREVYVYAFPIKIEGAFGAPARVLARDLTTS
jgi:kynurenine formamidase